MGHWSAWQVAALRPRTTYWYWTLFRPHPVDEGLALQSESPAYSLLLHWSCWGIAAYVCYVHISLLADALALSDIPMVTQSDPGTENFGIANAQTLLWQMHDLMLEGFVQHRWMHTKKNIKPEITWSQLRRRFCPGFEAFLETGLDEGWYDPDNTLQLWVCTCLLMFKLMHLIITTEWCFVGCLSPGSKWSWTTIKTVSTIAKSAVTRKRYADSSEIFIWLIHICQGLATRDSGTHIHMCTRLWRTRFQGNIVCDLCHVHMLNYSHWFHR